MTTRMIGRSEFRRRIPATLPAAEEFCQTVRRWAASLNIPNCFRVELLVREALINAVIHGCGNDQSKEVTCIVRLRPGRMVIAVRDPGHGFDLQGVSHLPDQDACSGRGIAIIRKYARCFRFNSIGNCTIMIVNLTGELQND